MAEDQAVFVSVVVEPKFAIMSINLDKFLPMSVLLGFVVFNQFELVREPTAHFKLINSKSVI